MSISRRQLLAFAGSAALMSRFSYSQSLTGEHAVSQSQLEKNKAIVARYFAEVIDKKNIAELDNLFTQDCIIHRPEVSEPLVGLDIFRRLLTAGLSIYPEMKSEIKYMIAEGNDVAIFLTHTVKATGEWHSRLGNFELKDKACTWNASAVFTLTNGKISEEFVVRDELGMAIDFGVIDAAHS